MSRYTCLCTHKAFTSHLTSTGCVGNTVFSLLVREVAWLPMELRGSEQDRMSVLGQRGTWWAQGRASGVSGVGVGWVHAEGSMLRWAVLVWLDQVDCELSEGRDLASAVINQDFLNVEKAWALESKVVRRLMLPVQEHKTTISQLDYSQGLTQVF